MVDAMERHTRSLDRYQLVLEVGLDLCDAVEFVEGV